MLVLVLKWVLVGRMTSEKCRRTDLLWRFNSHLWKMLMVRSRSKCAQMFCQSHAVLPAEAGAHSAVPAAAAPGRPVRHLLRPPCAPHPLPLTFHPTQPPPHAQDLPMYRTSSDPWTGTAAFNTYLRLQGAKVGKQVRMRTWAGHLCMQVRGRRCFGLLLFWPARLTSHLCSLLPPHRHPLASGLAGREVCVLRARPADHW